MPDTILSRTIQFNLKEISLNDIVSHLEKILNQEKVNYDLEALPLIASHARGSMRDALSFLDLLISQGEGSVILEMAHKSLGVVANELIFNLIELLLTRNTSALLEFLNSKLTSGLDYHKILDKCATWVYALAFEQQVLFSQSNRFGIGSSSRINIVEGHSDSDINFVKNIAPSVSPEKLQYLYQSFLRGKEEILLSPDPRIGFEMLCLRWIAFDPVSNVPDKELFSNKHKVDLSSGSSFVSDSVENNPVVASSDSKPAKELSDPAVESMVSIPSSESSKPGPISVAGTSPVLSKNLNQEVSDTLTEEGWSSFANSLNVTGLAYQVVLNLTFLSCENGELNLEIPAGYQNLLSDQIKSRVISSIKNKKNHITSVNIEVAIRASNKTSLSKNLTLNQKSDALNSEKNKEKDRKK